MTATRAWSEWLFPFVDLDEGPRLWDLPVLFPDPDREVAVFTETTRDEVVDGLTLDELAHLSRYTPALGEATAPMRTQLRTWLGAHAPAAAALAVEAGCSVGSELRLLRAFARRVIGFDVSPSALRAADAQLRGVPFPNRQRVEGRAYRHTHDWSLPPVDGVLVGLGSVFAPPVRDGVADIVVALNLIDNVADPLGAVVRLDAMLKPGGLLVIASPFAWRDDITPPDDQLGGGPVPAMAELGSAATLRAFVNSDTPLLPRLHHRVLEAADVPWTLRDHARCRISYDVHMMVSRKRATADNP